MSSSLRLPRQAPGVVRGGPSATVRAGEGIIAAGIFTDIFGEGVGGFLDDLGGDLVKSLPFETIYGIGDQIYAALQ
jgi:hypothetical protein